jgi:hypothetical protein
VIVAEVAVKVHLSIALNALIEPDLRGPVTW